MDSLETRARRALEEVCSGRPGARVHDFYSESFVDHVNAMEFRGTEGIQRSLALYDTIFDERRFVVEQQVTEGDCVAQRWSLHGINRGRRVTLTGITISRFEDGRIVEDWGSTDSLELVRQLGVWRSLVLLVTHPRLALGKT